MSERAWKRNERAIAARLGGTRVPVTGRQRGDAPDIAHPVYSVEVKARKSLPTWLHTAMMQAIAAQRGGQMPVVILHQTGTRHAEDLVVVRLGDFENWHGALPLTEAEALP
jgi:hypothetical protein